MAGRVAVLMVGFLALPSLAAQALAAQGILVPGIDGRVFRDNRPIDWLVEVRLEGQDGSVVATAYTRGSSEFKFENLILRSEYSYFLVIEQPGFEVVRYELRPRDFTRDPTRRISRFNGVASLSLVPLADDAGDHGASAEGPAAIDVRELLAEVPPEAEEELGLGQDAREAGDRVRAIAHFERAVELAPEYGAALNALGAEYIRAGRFAEADGMLGRASDLNPNDPVPLTNLGTLYYQQGEQLEFGADPERGQDAAQAFFVQAVEVLAAAVRLDPANARTNFYLGASLYKIGDYERAEGASLAALAADPAMLDAHLTLMNVYMRQQRYTLALEQIESYLEASPGSLRRAQLDELRARIESVLRGQ